jgi:hypothetical protein
MEHENMVIAPSMTVKLAILAHALEQALAGPVHLQLEQ